MIPKVFQRFAPDEERKGQIFGVRCISCEREIVIEIAGVTALAKMMRKQGWAVQYVDRCYEFCCPSCTATARARVDRVAKMESDKDG